MARAHVEEKPGALEWLVTSPAQPTKARNAHVGLLTKIFGNRDDPATEAGESSEEHPLELSQERPLERLEERPIERSEERPLERETSDTGATTPKQHGPKQHGSRPTPSSSGRLTFAAPPDESTPPGAGNGVSATRRRQRRAALASGDGGNRRPHEGARARIARPVVPSLEVPAIPPPIPDGAPRDLQASVYAADVGARGASTRAAGGSVATAAGHGTGRAEASRRPDADDPDEIDVSDQLEAVDDTEDVLDATADLIIEDDEDDEETSTSVAIWGAAAAGPSPASSPGAAPAPLFADLNVAVLPSRELESALNAVPSATSDESRADSEWTLGTEVRTPKRTIVEVGTELRGTLKSSCPVVINGTLAGEIDAPELSISPTGAVLGTIRANTLRSHGMLAGKIEAGEAYVCGTVRKETVIRTRRLEVKLASSGKGPLHVTFGACNFDPSDLPTPPDDGRPQRSSEK